MSDIAPPSSLDISELVESIKDEFADRENRDQWRDDLYWGDAPIEHPPHMRQADQLGIPSSIFDASSVNSSNGYLYNSILNATRSKWSMNPRHIKRGRRQRCYGALRIVEHLWGVGGGSPEEEAKELALNLIAGALVALDRK